MAKKRRVKNPVARCMALVTKAATHKDKTKYDRKTNGLDKSLLLDNK